MSGRTTKPAEVKKWRFSVDNDSKVGTWKSPWDLLTTVWSTFVAVSMHVHVDDISEALFNCCQSLCIMWGQKIGTFPGAVRYIM